LEDKVAAWALVSRMASQGVNGSVLDKQAALGRTSRRGRLFSRLMTWRHGRIAEFLVERVPVLPNAGRAS